MVGTILNGFGIVLGGIAGLTLTKQLSPTHQSMLKVGLGVSAVYVGLSLSWQSMNGTFWQIGRQLVIVVLAMTLGRMTGRLLRIQRGLNWLGQYAKGIFTRAQQGRPQRFAEGFITGTVLFCVGPMALLGSIQDGLAGNYRTLAIKALMDGLATMAFVPTFGWGVILSVIPLVAYQGTITLMAKWAAPFLENRALLDSVNATGGLLVFCIALVILELKRIELADYLPSLAFAPLLTWLGR